MSELDDFFAKKDRKKSKGKKFMSSEEKGKLDESTKNKDKTFNKERIPREDTDETTKPVQEPDEWREFEEEKKDYSGLKLGHLSITNNPGTGNDGGHNAADGADDGSQGGGEEGGDTEGGGCGSEAEGGGKQRHAGPWKRVSEPQQQQQQQQQQLQRGHQEKIENGQLDKQLHEESLPRTAGAYVAPGMRNQQLRGSHPGGGTRELQPMRLRGLKAAAPDIHNENYFPTLAAGVPGGIGGSKEKQGAFEVVSHGRGGGGHSTTHPRPSGTSNQQQQPPLSLGNRFNTLSSNDS